MRTRAVPLDQPIERFDEPSCSVLIAKHREGLTRLTRPEDAAHRRRRSSEGCEFPDLAIETPDDILFLEPDDVEDGATSDLRRLVAERRREWVQWGRVTPPEVIGIPSSTAAMTAAAAAAAGASELRGAPASRGVVTAPARILRSPDDVARLQTGEVMVCVMTTPAWTPLFGVAGGIITETGGILSHPAITAREYGIPAVLAVHEATKLMSDGQIVTIDGAEGVTTLHR